MSKILKYILFRTVLVIITLHTIIPHPHSDELTEEEHFELHEKSNSLIGIIRLAFHESDDESLDNLIYTQYESVKKIDSKHKYPTVSLFNTIQSIVEKRESEKIVKSNTNSFNKLLFLILSNSWSYLIGSTLLATIFLRVKSNSMKSASCHLYSSSFPGNNQRSHR